MRTDEIESTLFGHNLVTAENIPYGYSGFSFQNGYSIIRAKYYKLPEVDVFYKSVDDLFLTLIDLPYNAEQQNPNKIFESGGDCQAYSIYLRTFLSHMGIRCGYFPMSDHVCVWAVIDSTLYRVDVITKEFIQVSYADRAYLEALIDLEGIE